MSASKNQQYRGRLQYHWDNQGSNEILDYEEPFESVLNKHTKTNNCTEKLSVNPSVVKICLINCTVSVVTIGLTAMVMYIVLKQQISPACNVQNKLHVGVPNLNASIKTLISGYAEVLEGLTEQDRRLNETASNILMKIYDNMKQVAVTSCVSRSDDRSYATGEIIHFRDMRTTTGLQNYSSFLTTGKFTCEIAGLYLVMVTILTHNPVEAQYGIYKNDTNVVHVRDSSDSVDHSSSGMAAMFLGINDSVYIKTESSFSIQYIDSCITIVQVK